MDRRTFLKITGMGSIGFAAGCSSNPEGNLYTLVQAPEDMVTGKSTWYATTCRECPAGCGVLAKNREGRVVKLEGNPLHPVNQGKLCARGQAALQGVYNPDRIKTPLLKTESGWQSISHTKAVDILLDRMGQAAAKGPERIAMLTEVVGDTLLSLFNRVLADYGAKSALIYEPFGFESLKFAHKQVFNAAILPTLRMEKADLLVSFGADFLETWLSPVEYARKFKAMHAVKDGKKGRFIHISSYQSLTAANADQWFACRSGSEAAVVMMLMQAILDGPRGHHLEWTFRETLLRMLRPYTVANVAKLTGLPVNELGKLAHAVMSARRPLVLGSATAANGVPAAILDLASALLNAFLDPTLALYDFQHHHRIEIAATHSDIMTLFRSAAKGGLDLLLLNNVNPLYSLPQKSKAVEALARKELFVVSLANAMDETTAAAADLILPVQTALESWDVYESKQGLKATSQPAMGKLTPASHPGDLFLHLMPKAQRPASDYRSHLIQSLEDQGELTSTRDWISLFQSGGRFEATKKVSGPPTNINSRVAVTLAELIAQLPEGASNSR